MKKLFFFFLFIGPVCTIKAQVTNYPIVDNTRATRACITGVVLTPDKTIIVLDVSGSITDGYWVGISPHTRIEYTNPQTGLLETKKIVRLENTDGNTLSMGARYTYLPSNAFILIFPSIPRDVRKVNLVEEGKWKWYGINISPRSDVDVKRLATTEEGINRLIADSKNLYAGVYEALSATEFMLAIYKLALVQTDEGTFLVYVGSSKTIGTWKCGEIKAILRPTVSKYIYKADWYMANKTVSSAVVTFEGATMKLHIDQNNTDNVFVKMSGSTNSEVNTYSEKWSGTGFALKGGYILTNYHVVEEANIITIHGIGGDFTNGIEATIVGADKSNDLALLKILGNIPASLNSIPYGFKSKIADVGEDVYVLGYPLTATMGEEVKLTNGIISARTGFDGDVSQYQMSVPVQPGNSGGPLIDYNGNVIGVVCAKHKGAENVSYAVKVSQVRNLIESVSDLSIINTANTLQGKSLKDQVKFVNKYVYIIKCSK